MSGEFTAVEAVIQVVVLCILTSYLAYIFIKSDRTLLLSHYNIMTFSVILYLYGKLLVLLSPTQYIRSVMIVYSLTMRSIFDISFILFACFTFKKALMKRLSNWLLILLYISTTFAFALAGYLKGFMLYLFTGLGYAIRFKGVLYIINGFRQKNKKSDSYREFGILLLAAFTLQFLFEIRVFYSPVDLEPLIVLAVFTFIFFNAYSKLGVLNILSDYIGEIYENINNSVVVLDYNLEVLEKNSEFKKLDDHTSEVLLDNAVLMIKNSEDSRQIIIEEKESDYLLRVKPLLSYFNKHIGYVVSIYDNTELMSSIRSLEEKNLQLIEMNAEIERMADTEKQLAAASERHILAREIHDVMGHSLNYALGVLESNRITIKKEPEKALCRIKQAVAEIDRSLEDIINSKRTYEEINNINNFLNALKHIGNNMEEIGVHLELLGIEELNILSQDKLKDIFRICQEAITNALKHGKATNIIISAKREENLIRLRIIDNGTGCKKVIKGNGLKNMENRLNDMKGRINCSSFEGSNGFLLVADIPVH